MKRAIIGALGVAAGGVAVARWLASRRVPAAFEDEATRWLGVTVNRSQDEIMPGGRVPEPLAELDAEVRVNRAPGGRGTELYARPREHVPTGATAVLSRIRGDDPRQAVRVALREAKCVAETGEVLRPDAPIGTTRPTLPGKVLDAALRRAPGEGRL
ncbi:hypothetical protein GCM10009530_56090 [Microbispora corallina]|uniref:Uncharacterized protein n=1 Tax=Microbispora corallina TaxID=83302 RepID=A0ABQ4G965_9ACTN|nr:hypothetical protein [Microbispora corallina]GIH43569.1 hypothetical protein Mco01_65690 [Microbispora corallina]